MLMANLLVSAVFHVGPVAADMASTELVLRQPWMREEHIQSRGVRLGVNLGIALGATWLDKKMEKKPLLKWGFRLAHLALGAYAVQHNWREYEKGKLAFQMKRKGW